jgi:hypothetical protein
MVARGQGDGTPWHVQPTVQHDTEGLWKKLRPYVEEKGGMLGFVEFRFKVANELEALQQWLEVRVCCVARVVLCHVCRVVCRVVSHVPCVSCGG